MVKVFINDMQPIKVKNNMSELVSLKHYRFTLPWNLSNFNKPKDLITLKWKSSKVFLIDHKATFLYSFITTLFNNTSIHESFFLSVVWCLDYQYTAYGDSQGQLNVYMLVNGERDEPLVSRSGSTSSILHWYREQIILHASHYSSSDMIEVRWQLGDRLSVTKYRMIKNLRITYKPTNSALKCRGQTFVSYLDDDMFFYSGVKVWISSL